MIHRVAVVGAGTMGAGIAQLCAQCGFAVKVHDSFPKALELLPARLKSSFDAAVLKGKLTTQQAERAFLSVSPAATLEELDGADIVIEAAAENLEIKRALWPKLAKILPDAILATNTSSLSVAAIGEAAPERTLGLHFFNPPVAMKLVELVRTDKTNPDIFRETWDWVIAGLRKTPVDVKDRPGFIVNRVMRPYYVTAQQLGGHPGEIDLACRRLGLPMGPFELMDLIGLDVNLSITKIIYEALGRPERFTPPEAQQKLVALGHIGRKAGFGWHVYQGGRPTMPNPEAVKVLRESSEDPDGVARRLVASVIEEAKRALEEDVAGKADIDTAVKLAMGWPKGPLEWAKN
jgi:3-hydroxybutyryl-CoA dehydrogenase